MNNIYPLLFATAVLLTGCGHNETTPEGARTVSVDLADARQVAFDPGSLIPLETNDSSVIYDICEVAPVGDRLVVQSRNFIRVFDRATGRYLHNVSRVGQGPDEYLGIGQFWNNGDTLVLLDSNNGSIARFLSNGTFVDRSEAPKRETPTLVTKSMYIVPAADRNGYYIINVYTGGSTDTNPKYSYVDAGMQFVSDVPDCELTEGSFTPDRMITDFNKGRVLSWDQMRDTLYTVDREGQHPLYIFDFGKNRVPQDISSLKWFGERVNKFAENKSDTPYASFIKYYQPYKDVIFFSFATSDEKVYLAEYDEAADKITTFRIHDPEGRYKQSFFFKVDGDTLLVSMNDDDPDTNPMLYKLPITSIPR